MSRISLAAYTIRIKKKYDSKALRLNNFDDANSDLFIILNNYMLSRRSSPSLDEKNKKRLIVNSYESIGRTLMGIIETGEYGYEAKLVNTDDNSISYNRRTNDAEMYPFFFLIDLPNSCDEGILILQRFKQFGIRSILESDFFDYFQQKNNDFIVKYNPLVPDSYIEKTLSSGRLISISFVQFKIPDDIASAIRYNHVEGGGYAEYKIHAARNDHIPLVENILSHLRKRNRPSAFVELENVSYDTVKFQFATDSGVRTIDISNLLKIKAYFDVTEEVEIGIDGHPVYSSIKNAGIKLKNDVLKSIGVCGSV